MTGRAIHARVWILTHEIDYHGSAILAVHATESAAESDRDSRPELRGGDYYEITEYEVQHGRD